MHKQVLPSEYEWGICITHDVDHMSHGEHSFGVILKFIGVCFKELATRRRSFKEFCRVIANCFRKTDSWDCLEELAELDKKHDIPATFFFAMKPGLGLEYKKESAEKAIKKLGEDFEVGAHGQEKGKEGLVKEEFEQMGEILGKKPLGIRMHALQQSEGLRKYLKRAGYEYDATEYSEDLKQAYVTQEGLTEIPFHIMDTYLFSPFYMNMTLEEAKEYTRSIIHKAKKQNLIVSILIHQRSLSEDLPRQRAYYKWLLEELGKDKKCCKLSCADIAKKCLKEK